MTGASTGTRMTTGNLTLPNTRIPAATPCFRICVNVCRKASTPSPRGSTLETKRADMRVSYLDFQIPIEVKKNRHRDLWSALKNQLIQQYTTDPATEGYGIYLVFWFDPDDTQSPPSGPRPASPQELQRKLEANPGGRSSAEDIGLRHRREWRCECEWRVAARWRR